MSKMNELSAILDEMIECGNGLVKAATALRGCYSSNEDQEAKPEEKETTPPTKDTKTYSKEEVRGLLSQKAIESNGKFKTVVKDLVKKYANGGSLKDIVPENYETLVAELEVVTNA
jgi:hypothetical protein